MSCLAKLDDVRVNVFGCRFSVGYSFLKKYQREVLEGKAPLSPKLFIPRSSATALVLFPTRSFTRVIAYILTKLCFQTLYLLGLYCWLLLLRGSYQAVSTSIPHQA